MKRWAALALFVVGGVAASGIARVVEPRGAERPRLVVDVAGLDAAGRERAIDQGCSHGACCGIGSLWCPRGIKWK